MSVRYRHELADQWRHSPLSRQRSPWVPQEVPSPVPGVMADWFSRNVSDGTLWACVAAEPAGWHVSISFRNHRGEPSRYPTWDEQVHALREIGPRGIPFAMHLPCDDAGYVALHPSTFHWHQDTSKAEHAELVAHRRTIDRLQRECERLQRDCAAWMNGVADAVEPLGFDREAACGPADLLPGLLTLVERSRAHAPDLNNTRSQEREHPDDITYRSTGRGAYDVIENRAEGPDRVLAQVLFTEGVRGRVAALDRFTDALARVAQEPL